MLKVNYNYANGQRPDDGRTNNMSIEVMKIKNKTAVWSLTNGNKANRIVRETVREKIDDFDAVGQRPNGGNNFLSLMSEKFYA